MPLILTIFLLWSFSGSGIAQNANDTALIENPESCTTCESARVQIVGGQATYTNNSDFDNGSMVSVNYDDVADQLQLNNQSKAFDFIWVAASVRGTIVKINTQTGEILGEYWSAPDGQGRDPSRTTVDNNGNVWAGNRAEYSGGKGSAVRIGLNENLQCQDRNSNGKIDTSTGLGDIKPWPNTGGADSNGGVSTAEDECICNYIRTAATGVRSIAVDTSNNVWIGGTGNRMHELYDGITGQAITGTLFGPGCGGYGALIDNNGILWSSQGGDCLLRYDPINKTVLTIPNSCTSYGLGRDSQGNIWNSQYSCGSVRKYTPDGVQIGDFSTHGNNPRGVAVTSDDDVWVANSGSDTVARLSNAGVWKLNINVGMMPTGVSVDSNGKVWVANYGSSNVMRIDPATNLVDLTLSLGEGAYPYDYSDMTGSSLIAPPNTGSWTAIYSSGQTEKWSKISWTADTPGDSMLAVKAATSDDGTTFGPYVDVVNGASLSISESEYIKVAVSFTRATTKESPILYDLTITTNEPPNCTMAVPSLATIWPADNRLVNIAIRNVTDPDGNPVKITIFSIRQDEPVDTYGDGSFAPDGMGVGTSSATVRAESVGINRVPGNGRVYHIGFTADDGLGGICNGEVLVGVHHIRNKIAKDDGAIYDSTKIRQ